MSEETYSDVDAAQWNQSPAKQTESEGDETPDEEPLVTETDDEMAPEEGGTIVQAETPSGTDVSVQMDAVGRTETGDIVVGSAGQMNGGAANDGKTEDGIGQEFGVWGDEFIHVDDGYVLPRPDGQTAMGVQRIAGREKELHDIHQRYYVPATDGGDIVLPRKRAEIEQRHVERVQSHREALSREHHTSGVRLGFDYFNDEASRDRARNESATHRAFHPRFLELGKVDEADPEGEFHENYTTSGERVGVCRWADRTNGERTPLVRGTGTEAPQPIEHDLEDDLLYELTMELFDRVGDKDGFIDLGLGIRDVRSAVRDALEATNRSQTSAIIKASEELFHDGQTLRDIEPWWTGATARVRVERLFEPNDPSTTQQVAHVTDVSPTVSQTSTGTETAKLTIWNRSDVDQRLAEGDIVELSNIKPGRFGDQLTLAVTSNTSVYRLHRGDGPKTGREDALTQGNPTPQDLTVFEDGKTVDIDYSEGPPALAVTRYRRPEATAVTEELGWNESAAVAGSEANRDPMLNTMNVVFPTESVPEWFVEANEQHYEVAHRTMSGEDAVFGADPFSAADLAGEYEAIPSGRMKAVIDLFGGAYERLESVRTAEHVYEQFVDADERVAVRIYTSVVGQWARPIAESRIHVTVEDFRTNDVEVVERINRTEGWAKRLAGATKQAEAQAVQRVEQR